MQVWGFDAVPARERADLLAPPVAAALEGWKGAEGEEAPLVAPIDPDLADTAACCERYGVPPEASANCVIVAGRRAGEVRMAACVVLATTRADVNGAVRRLLGARKASFARQEDAVEATGMAFGGITPVGLPPDWPVLVDAAAAERPRAVIGAGVRSAKLIVPGAALARLPGAQVVDGLGVAAAG